MALCTGIVAALRAHRRGGLLLIAHEACLNTDYLCCSSAFWQRSTINTFTGSRSAFRADDSGKAGKVLTVCQAQRLSSHQIQQLRYTLTPLLGKDDDTAPGCAVSGQIGPSIAYLLSFGKLLFLALQNVTFNSSALIHFRQRTVGDQGSPLIISPAGATRTHECSEYSSSLELFTLFEPHIDSPFYRALPLGAYRHESEQIQITT